MSHINQPHLRILQQPPSQVRRRAVLIPEVIALLEIDRVDGAALNHINTQEIDSGESIWVDLWATATAYVSETNEDVTAQLSGITRVRGAAMGGQSRETSNTIFVRFFFGALAFTRASQRPRYIRVEIRGLATSSHAVPSRRTRYCAYTRDILVTD